METFDRAMAFLDEFRYVPDQTALSRTWIPWTTCVVYFCTLRVLQRVMKNRKAMDFPWLLFTHNMLLSAGSLALFCLLAGTVFLEKGPEFQWKITPMLCSREFHEESGRLQFSYFVNNLFKYYELLDTVLLVLRKKPVPFLHEYHHAATLALTWSQMREHSTVQWVPIVINLFVHIVMYYYYAMSAIKIRIWWKKYLTSLQISQFIAGVTTCSYAYGVFIYNGFDHDKCWGTQLGAITGIAILMSYLLLFIRFYFQTYRAPKSKTS